MKVRCRACGATAEIDGKHVYVEMEVPPKHRCPLLLSKAEILRALERGELEQIG